MPLAMRKSVFITAAVTGSGGTQDRSHLVPRSPKQIAEAAIDAALHKALETMSLRDAVKAVTAQTDQKRKIVYNRALLLTAESPEHGEQKQQAPAPKGAKDRPSR